MTEQLMVKQERAARTRDSLIRSAAEVFDRGGSSAASLTLISAQAGVSNGALHFHFASKASLVDAVGESALARLLAVTAGARQPGQSQVQLLVDATHALAGALRADVVLRVGFALSGEASRPVQADLRQHWRHWVERTVKQAEAGGELRRGAGAQDAAMAVVAATMGFEVLGTRDAAWLSAPTVAGFWQLLLPALVPAADLAAIDADGSDGIRALRGARAR
ncbi:ScbR family autoregulator-binding transcription factor [Streptomyces sp. NPDC056347]|uniref:ScbR family autoregulator-binding transcription factor n=1 Tax=Streptomyces sp. NPDC056347 TaxID=3345790 RepID=UPI0035D760DD